MLLERVVHHPPTLGAAYLEFIRWAQSEGHKVTGVTGAWQGNLFASERDAIVYGTVTKPRGKYGNN